MNKYRAIRTNGYDSKAEARRAEELKLLERLGEISELRMQVTYELIPKQQGERAVKYIADFEYTQNGEKVTEDCKGFRTPEYRLKKKMMLYFHGIRILETK